MARLYVLSGPDVGKSFEIAPGATLGRSTDCGAVLRDHSVSRQHARLDCRDGHWTVVDLESRNGVLVGGQKTRSAEIRDGAEFQLGEVLLRFRTDASAAPEPPAAREPPPIEEEIVLEGVEEPAPAPVQSPFPKPASPSPELVRTARRPAPALELRDRGVLQYSKVETQGGFLQEDLAQQPWYLKLGVWLGALLLFAFAAWAAFHATSFFKEKVSGPENPADSTAPR